MWPAQELVTFCDQHKNARYCAIFFLFSKLTFRKFFDQSGHILWPTQECGIVLYFVLFSKLTFRKFFDPTGVTHTTNQAGEKYLEDFSTLIQKMANTRVDGKRLCSIGKAVQKAFDERYPNREPEKVKRHVNWPCDQWTYILEIDRPWIEDLVRSELNKVWPFLFSIRCEYKIFQPMAFWTLAATSSIGAIPSIRDTIPRFL